MAQLFANAARAELSADISSGSTTITIASGGSLFPAITGGDWFKAVLEDATGIEIVYVTAHTSGSNSFTVTRGQEGTSARAFLTGDIFGLRVTANDMAAAIGWSDEIGVTLQAYDGDLDAIAALAGTSGLLKKTAANTWTLDTAAYSTTTGTVTTASVVSANGFAGTVANASTTPAITLTTSISGILKGNGTAISAASAGTDYLAPPSGTAILKANSGGALANASAGTDYVAPGTATTFTAAQTFDGGLILTDEVRETPTTANTGTSYTVTITNGTLFNLTLTGNCTFTFPTATAGRQFTLLLKQDGTGSRTITWPSSVRWAGGTAPTITATAAKTDVISFVADGTYWLGFVGGQNYTRA